MDNPPHTIPQPKTNKPCNMFPLMQKAIRATTPPIAHAPKDTVTAQRDATTEIITAITEIATATAAAKMENHMGILKTLTRSRV